MRIIGGTYRGKKLNTPPTNHIRPTTDRMRETLFNILEHGTGPGIHGSRVLDLFAGTGALGIEALSRGAEHVTFVDNDRRSAKLISQNLAEIQNPENIDVLTLNAWSLVKNLGQFDVIFIDPPYHQELINPTLSNIVKNALLIEDGIIMIEYAYDENPEIPHPLEEIKKRKMGDASFSLLIKKS